MPMKMPLENINSIILLELLCHSAKLISFNLYNCGQYTPWYAFLFSSELFTEDGRSRNVSKYITYVDRQVMR